MASHSVPARLMWLRNVSGAKAFGAVQRGLLGQSYSTIPAAETTAGQILQRHIPLTSSGHIRVLELNRPQARNAISRSLLAQLRNHIDDVAHQYGPNGEEVKAYFSSTTSSSASGIAPTPSTEGYTRVLVLASAVDESFCAGADLKERRGMSQDETAAFLTLLRSTLVALERLQIPTIAAIGSSALGGGLELALATTLRVVATTATLGLPETRLGIIPGAGGTYRLPRIVGVNRARDMILTGRKIGAAEAYLMGIADRMVEVNPLEGDQTQTMDKERQKLMLRRGREAALTEAIRLAQEIGEGGPIAVRAGLRATGLDAAEELENKMYLRVVDCEDKHEALAAFQQKRKPVFTGR